MAENLPFRRCFSFVKTASKYISESTGACDLCDSLNEQSFKMINAKVGINYPPIHPNCKCRVSALKFGSIIGYPHQPKDIINNLSKLLDNLPYIDKNVKRIEQKNNDEDTLSTLTYPDYHTEYGHFYEYPWVKTTPPTETITMEEDYDIEPFMKIPLEERTKWPYQGYDDLELNNILNEFKKSCESNTYYEDIVKILDSFDTNINNEVFQAIDDIKNVTDRINTDQHQPAQRMLVIEMYTFTRIMQVETGVPAALIIAEWSLESSKGQNMPIDAYTNETSNNMFGLMEFDLKKPHITILFKGKELHFKKFNNSKDSIYAFCNLMLNKYKPENENTIIE